MCIWMRLWTADRTAPVFSNRKRDGTALLYRKRSLRLMRCQNRGCWNLGRGRFYWAHDLLLAVLAYHPPLRNDLTAHDAAVFMENQGCHVLSFLLNCAFGPSRIPQNPSVEDANLQFVPNWDKNQFQPHSSGSKDSPGGN